MRTKEEIYEEATLKSYAENPMGTREDVTHKAMEIYAKEYHETEVLKLNKACVTRSFRLTPSEQEAFEKSGSKEIRFSIGGGIGIGVSYLTDKKKWKDITDYGSW